jgi:hypothetical protein
VGSVVAEKGIYLMSVRHKSENINRTDYVERIIGTFNGRLSGDGNQGKCECPVCHKRALSITNKGGRILLNCFAYGTKEHNREVAKELHARGLLPSTQSFAPLKRAEKEKRPLNDRIAYARNIWKDLSVNKDQYNILAQFYLTARGIDWIPYDVRMVLPVGIGGETEIKADDFGMVMPIRREDGRQRGIVATWLNSDCTGKRKEEPQRNSYGEVKGNFVPLSNIDYASPPEELLIGEGIETTAAAMQLVRRQRKKQIPGIATAGAGMMPHVNPPWSQRYYILGDNGEVGQKAVKELALKLVDDDPKCKVHIATPARPANGKEGYDWNDALIDAGNDEDKLNALGKVILSAPAYDPKNDPFARIRMLAKLKLSNPIAYEQARSQAAADLGLRKPILDAEVNEACKVLKQQEAPKVDPVSTEDLKRSAGFIIGSEDVLGLFADDVGRRVVGEEKNVKMLYLVNTSRLLNETMHAALKGPSAAGKSKSREYVNKYFPPEDIISFTALSEKALLYCDRSFEHKILSMGEALSGEEQSFQDSMLRQLMSEGKLEYVVAQKLGDHVGSVTIAKQGPVVFTVTTTKNKLHPENETRMLSLEFNDTAEQTKAVLRKISQVIGLNKSTDIDVQPWHDFQRWLSRGDLRVFIPFAEALDELIPPKALRLRRDYEQVLIAIKVHAILHREHRRRGSRGSIIATIEDDYAAVRRLINAMLEDVIEVKLRPVIAETIKVVRENQPDVTDTDNLAGKGLTVRKVAEFLDLDRSSARRRLYDAEEKGYLVNVEERRGRAAQYRTTPQKELKSESLLPSVKELKAVAAELRGRKERR